MRFGSLDFITTDGGRLERVITATPTIGTDADIATVTETLANARLVASGPHEPTYLARQLSVQEVTD